MIDVTQAAACSMGCKGHSVATGKLSQPMSNTVDSLLMTALRSGEFGNTHTAVLECCFSETVLCL